MATAFLLAAGPALAGDPPRSQKPATAEPDPYAKICDVYGIGFKQVPGTDTCVKISGYVGMDVTVTSGSGPPPQAPPPNPQQ